MDDAKSTKLKRENNDNSHENDTSDDEDDSNAWWTAEGDIVLFYDPLMSNNGTAIANIPLSEPNYPLFHGLKESPPGPAPFVPLL